MRNSIVVYRIMSENPEFENMNVSFADIRHLENMGVVEKDRSNYEVHRTENTTVTVYSYRKAR